MSENKPSLAEQAGADFLNHKVRMEKALAGHREIVHPKKYPAITTSLERPDIGHMEFTLDPEHPGQSYELNKRMRGLAKEIGPEHPPLPTKVLEGMAARDYGKDKIIEAGSYDPLCREKGIDLLTRGAGLERLKQAIATIRRTRQGSIAVFFADLDKFKNINDNFPEGHPGGDALIRCAAESLQQTGTRDTDFSVRYGGEELMKVLLMDGDPRKARKAAKKLALALQKRYALNQRRALATKGIFLDEADKQLLERDYGNFPSLDELQTMSIGIAFISAEDPRLDDPTFIDILLKEANEAEHAAKTERNRVAIMKDGKPVLVDPDLSEHPVTVEEISPEEQAKVEALRQAKHAFDHITGNKLGGAMGKLELALMKTDPEDVKRYIEDALEGLSELDEELDTVTSLQRFITEQGPDGKPRLNVEASLEKQGQS